MKKKAIVVCIEGTKYQAAFERIFFPGIRTFAWRHGYDVFFASGSKIRSLLQSSPSRSALAGIPPSWLKIFAIQSVQSLGYSKVLFLDADIFVSPVAEDYFSLLPDECVSAIVEATIPESKVLLWRQACGLEADGTTSMINGGVLYLAGEAGVTLILDVIAHIDRHKLDIDFKNRVFEQPILSEYLLKHPAYKRMRYLYNTLLYSDRGERMPDVQRIRSGVNRFCSRLPAASRYRTLWFWGLFMAGGTYARGNRKLMQELLAEGRFIHFAGINDEWCITRPFIIACPPEIPAPVLL